MYFAELTAAIFRKPSQPLILNPTCFAISSLDEVAEVQSRNISSSGPQLIESMRNSLTEYKRNYPRTDIYDLSQSQTYARKSLVNGEMPCLATSSTHLWSNKLKRCFTGREKLKTLLAPVDKVDLSEFGERTLTSFAGNGMFLPNVGYAILAHILCINPIDGP